MSQKLYDNADEIGARFRSARSLVRLTRKAFCDKHGISKFTVQAWENGRHVSRGANLQKFCEALKLEGVLCGPEWLLDNVGAAPTRLSSKELETTQTRRDSHALYEEGIAREAEAFCATYSAIGDRAHVVCIADNAMSPLYEKGCYVGGKLLYEKQIDQLIGKVCIVEVHDDRFLVRKLLKDGERYLLLAERADEGLISVKSPISVAKIVWHRMRD